MPHPNDSFHARRRRKAARLEGGSMQVLGGKDRPAALLTPGVDFITETAAQQSAGERVIDTGFDFVPGVATRLNGRKYINENTVKDLATLIGYVDGDATRRIQAEFDDYKSRVTTLLQELEGIGARVSDVIAAAQPDPNAISVTPPPDATELADQTAANTAVADSQITDAEKTRAEEAAAAAATDGGGTNG